MEVFISRIRRQKRESEDGLTTEERHREMQCCWLACHLAGNEMWHVYFFNCKKINKREIFIEIS